MIKYKELKEETKKLSSKIEGWTSALTKKMKTMKDKLKPDLWKESIPSVDKKKIKNLAKTIQAKIISLKKTGEKQFASLIKEGKKQITSFNKTSDKSVDYISKKSDKLKKDFDKFKKEGTKKVELYKKEGTKKVELYKKEGTKKIELYKKEATSKRNSFFYYTVLKLEKYFPKEANITAGKWFGNFSYRFNRARRNIALQQIKIAFPDWSSKKIQETAIASFESLGKVLFETIKKVEYAKNINEWLENKNQKVIDEISKTGAIIINGHFANWEFGTYSFELAKLKGILIGKEEHELAKWFVNHFRNAKDFETLSSTNNTLPLKIVRTLKNNQCVHLLIDLDILAESVYCQFFGRKTRTVVSPARLAIKYKKPVVSCFNYRTTQGKHVFCYEFLSKPPYSSEMSEEKLTQIYTTAIEKHIRKYPSQWRWAESRWKPDRWGRRDEKTAN